MRTTRHLALIAASVAVFLGSVPAQAGTITYTYDALGRVITATYPNGETITYTYDNAGNRKQVTQGGGH
jgi:YD repeat-containing protein